MKSNKSFPNVPWMELGYGDDFAAGLVTHELGGKLVRIKATVDSAIRLTSQTISNITMTAGEKEYFFIPEGDSITVISGNVNIMW